MKIAYFLSIPTLPYNYKEPDEYRLPPDTDKILYKPGSIDMGKRKGAIPEHFNNAEEAGKFWDSHSFADYWDEMEEEEMEFDIQKRTFLVPVDSRIYLLAKKQAEAEHKTVEQIVNTLLNRELIKAK